jgi:hypothetical protein
LYYCPINDFTVIQDTDETLATFTTTYDKLTTISTAHTFTGTKGFLKMYNTQNSGTVEYQRQGERDGYSYKAVLKFFYPGAASLFYGWQRKAKNDRFMFLALQPNGVIHQIGNKQFPAYLSPDKGGTASNEGGRNGFEFMVETMASGPILYNSTITLHT